jgi:hypothetical protein
LLPDSPAINAGDPAARAGVDGVPLGDQRGAEFTRVYGGRIDIGAFERQPTEFLLGDFNRNETVDAADLILWRKANGRTDDLGNYVDARGNGDGIVDESDYEIWRANFGNTISVSATDASNGFPLDPAPDAQEMAAVPTNPSASILLPRRDRPNVRANVQAATTTARTDVLVTRLIERQVRPAGRDDAQMALDSPSKNVMYVEAVDIAITTFIRGLKGAMGRSIEYPW